MLKCPFCCSRFKRGTFTEKFHGKTLGKFSGWICTGCGETLIGEKEARRMEKIVKKLGLWGKKT